MPLSRSRIAALVVGTLALAGSIVGVALASTGPAPLAPPPSTWPPPLMAATAPLDGPQTDALPTTATTTPPAPARHATATTGSYLGLACGGSLPPCWVLQREDPQGDLAVWNGGCHAPVGWTGGPPCGPGHSTASGKWQFIRSTWAGYGGYVNAADAPEAVQDAKAVLVWAGGAGCSHWSAC